MCDVISSKIKPDICTYTHYLSTTAYFGPSFAPRIIDGMKLSTQAATRMKFLKSAPRKEKERHSSTDWPLAQGHNQL